MTYNFTAFGSESTTATGLFQAVNDHLLMGYFGLMILIGLDVVLFLSFYFSNGDTRRSMLSVAFISFVFSLALAAAQILPTTALFASLVLSAATIALTWRE